MSDRKIYNDLCINSERLWNNIKKFSQIGPGVHGGCNRQTLTDADSEARNLFQSQCLSEKLEVSVDQIGNMFCLRKGKNNNLLPIAMGSHLDIQPTGGKYDGVLGILAGLEVVCTLNEKKHPNKLWFLIR